MEIEINGNRYQKIEKQQRSKGVNRILMMAAMLGGLDGIGGKTRQRPNVILEQEYGLIQEKKSKLCRNDRDWVVYQFERQYKRID